MKKLKKIWDNFVTHDPPGGEVGAVVTMIGIFLIVVLPAVVAIVKAPITTLSIFTLTPIFFAIYHFITSQFKNKED